MKILLISSSPHKEKSQTFLLAQEVLKGCTNKTVKSGVIHLRDYRIMFCRHCEECHKKIMHCPIKDDVPTILREMLEAEGIILASPNYINQITASMKALLDRSSHFIHCKRLLGKYIIGVVSSGSGQDKDVLDYIKHYAYICGAQYSGGISSRAPVNKERMEEAFKLGNKLSLDIRGEKGFLAQTKIIEEGKEHFKKIIKIRKNEWIEEYQYWQDKGWL
ncbi:MAG TPA: flavodoxin family protein [bacterium]|nr:flavodoxin family protein [bacterium]